MMFPGADPVSRRLAAIGHEFDHGMALKLDRIVAALDALGRPQDRLPPTFHVAGTNGKGSTCAFLRAIAESAGLKAHVFASPHLVKPNERVRLAGRLVDDDAFIAAIDRVAATGLTLTYFEAMTAAAFVLFADTHADVLVLEVGLGGRFDATNVIDRPAASVIAPIDYDHMALLGDTLSAIASEKAGVMKRGAPAVVARQDAEAMDVIAREAERVGAQLHRCGVEWDCWRANGRLAVQTQTRFLDLPTPSLVGPHQFDNAGLAVAGFLQAFDAPDDAIGAGVASAQWPARMQRLTQGPLADIARAAGAELWLDGGHNPHGARAIAATLAELDSRAPAPTALVCGMLATKDAAGFLAPLAPRVSLLIAAPVASSSSGRDPGALADIARNLGVRAQTAATLAEAVQLAAQDARRILICGSLYLAGEALALSGGVD